MSQETDAKLDLATEYAKLLRPLEDGQIVRGTIVDLTPTDVIVDIGYKSEGVIPLAEFSDPAGLKIGDEIEVLLETKETDEGNVLLSKRKVDRTQGWERIMMRSREGDFISGRVSKKVKGGLMVDLGGIEAFLPASLAFLKGYGNLQQLLGQELEFKIIKINKPRKNIIVSRKEAILKEQEHQRAKLFDSLEKGQVRTGLVKNVTDFGAFISLGGVDGLLHITDMSWGRVGHPGEVTKVGDEVQVMVLDFDRESGKISLGLKQLQPNPWQHAAEKYPAGLVAQGKVVSIVPYGAFVELEPGIEGLIHISEFSMKRRVAKPQDLVNVGDTIEVAIQSVEAANQKMSLGLHKSPRDPWTATAEKYHPGDRVAVKVRSFADYGMFVELEDGIEGVISVHDVSWTRRVHHPQELYKKGQRLEATVLTFDPDKRKLTLGLKQLAQDPWPQIVQRYPDGMVVDGKITKVSSFGLFVELEPELEGLLHVSELADGSSVAPSKGEKPTGAVRLEERHHPGDAIRVKVLRVDPTERKIALSAKC